MSKLLDNFRRDEKGTSLVEYGILLAMIAVVCIVATTTLGTELSSLFSSVAVGLETV